MGEIDEIDDIDEIDEQEEEWTFWYSQFRCFLGVIGQFHMKINFDRHFPLLFVCELLTLSSALYPLPLCSGFCGSDVMIKKGFQKISGFCFG